MDGRGSGAGRASGADVVRIYLRVRPRDIAYLKFVVESYEGVAVVRTVDRAGATIVLLAPPDQEAEARAILGSLGEAIPWTEVPPPADLPEDWLERELTPLPGRS